MFDFGNVRGRRTFHTGDKTLLDLIASGEIIAIPDAQCGIRFKRPERCTALEMAARYSADEAEVAAAEWNRGLEQNCYENSANWRLTT